MKIKFIGYRTILEHISLYVFTKFKVHMHVPGGDRILSSVRCH